MQETPTFCDLLNALALRDDVYVRVFSRTHLAGFNFNSVLSLTTACFYFTNEWKLHSAVFCTKTI